MEYRVYYEVRFRAPRGLLLTDTYLIERVREILHERALQLVRRLVVRVVLLVVQLHACAVAPFTRVRILSRSHTQTHP